MTLGEWAWGLVSQYWWTKVPSYLVGKLCLPLISLGSDNLSLLVFGGQHSLSWILLPVIQCLLSKSINKSFIVCSITWSSSYVTSTDPSHGPQGQEPDSLGRHQTRNERAPLIVNLFFSDTHRSSHQWVRVGSSGVHTLREGVGSKAVSTLGYLLVASTLEAKNQHHRGVQFTKPIVVLCLVLSTSS